ncbi:MAG TPA: MBL fold metallo-hydrolase [Kofleriaceae bacterium]|jgi:L-ascorbate metabolism protein UlaG (beta-lactamase superfamily)|nr:MBL fold metallo-hydrolase [Kofleriaceae bacterium]
MARFDERATTPARGPGHILRWKLGKKEPRPEGFAALDAFRLAVDRGGAGALAGGAPVAVWIGHATWALRLAGKLIVTDPIWSRSIGGAVRRLVAPGVALDAMPAVDVVLVTHDHRDHMDLPTIRKLPDQALYIVPIGNASRLGKPNIVELDWWQTHEVGDLAVTLVPARHWSMRMPWNRNATLWGGYVIRSPEGTAYHAGDTAWGDHFVEIGAKAGPIDWAMLPIGGYAPRWFMEPQHIDPSEAGRGYEALGARHLLAMHWGTFPLTDEAIGEPPARLRAYWTERALDPARLWIVAPGEPRALTR